MPDSKTNMKCLNVCCDCSVFFSSVHLYEQKQAVVGVLLTRHTVPIRQDPFCLSFILTRIVLPVVSPCVLFQ